jgi:hypothetical protein
MLLDALFPFGLQTGLRTLSSRHSASMVTAHGRIIPVLTKSGAMKENRRQDTFSLPDMNGSPGSPMPVVLSSASKPT